MKSKILLLILISFSITALSVPNKQLPKEGTGPWVVNVYYENLTQLRSYVHKNEPWFVNRDQMYFTLSVANLHEYQELFSYGFKVEINQKQMILKRENKLRIEALKNTTDDNRSIPGYECIRTVEETFLSMDSLVSQYPTLASTIDVGDTWEKATPGGNPGYDMRVIKITNSDIVGTKPILYVTSSIHAREMAPAELNIRFAEYLLNNYGTDADVTWIVDHREVHLLPQGNPDGRKRAESSDTNKRKNQNNNYCGGNNTRGVDMNRNFTWMWNQGSGSSSSQCSQVFRGPSPQSELENTAIDTYLKTLFIDARGPNIGDAAPIDTTGIYLDIHSVASLILWPYGFDDPGTIPIAPNDIQLQTLGRKFGWYNGYYPEKANELYGADGASDDNAYGQLGVAAYTFELGGGSFRPSCGSFENTILPNNLKALIYAAKVSDTPYITASGPDIDNMNLSANDVIAGTMITVTGAATDAHFNNVNGAEATQFITSIEMYIDELPWDNASTPIILSPVDGSLNSDTESFTGVIDTTGLSSGQHIIYIQSTDFNAVTGVPYAKFFNIVNPNDIGTLSGMVKDAMTNLPIEAAIVNFGSNQTNSNAQGQFNLSILAGNYSLFVKKQGYTSTTVNNITVNALQNTTQDVQLQAVCALLDDDVDAYGVISAAVSAGWSHASNQGADDWNISSSGGISATRAFRTQDVASTSDKYLVSPELNITADSTLEFLHKYQLEDEYDGAIIEITNNNGLNWVDLGTNITTGGYNTTLNGGFTQPLGAILAWNGSQSSFTKVEVDLSSYAGETVKIRWRIGTDSGVGGGDWIIDDIKVLDPSACINNDIIFISDFE